ncbi:MAG: Exopolyphosphatase 1 [Verrucomicrobiae bacterium]|nr:Exopolyphosphatase 1 [Verrucomicrobiae bacterium]
MKKHRRAVIDIGTNTVKLFIADVHDGQVVPVVAKDKTTRLGEGVHATRQLAAPAIARTVQTIADYMADAREHAVAGICGITTSAVRDAANQQEFLDAVRRQCGLEVKVISGDREAELIFRGVCSDPAVGTSRLLVMDVGGGSVEFIQGAAGQIERHLSLPLGAVRMTERFGEDFPALAQFLRTTYRTALRDYRAAGRKFIATGGANLTLVRIAQVRTFDEVLALVARLQALTLAERRQVPGLPVDRADIIVAGGAALAFAMEAVGAYELTVSTRNLRYGALLEIP